MAVTTGDIYMSWAAGFPPYVWWGDVYTGTPRSYDMLRKTKNLTGEINANMMKGTACGAYGYANISAGWTWSSPGSRQMDVYTDTAWYVTIVNTIADQFRLIYASANVFLETNVGADSILGGNGYVTVVRQSGDNSYARATITITYSTEGSHGTQAYDVYGDPY